MENHKRWGKSARFHDTEKGREILLHVAIQCLAQKGIRSTTMQDVANAAHVSRRTVYRYFPDRDEMLREVFNYGRELTFRAIRECAAPHADDFRRYFEEAIVAAVRYHLQLDQGSDIGVEEDRPANMQTYLDYEAYLSKWKDVLREPYRKYVAASIRPDAERSLEHYAELANLLVAGHCQLQSSEEKIRQNFRNLIALSGLRRGSPALPGATPTARKG